MRHMVVRSKPMVNRSFPFHENPDTLAQTDKVDCTEIKFGYEEFIKPVSCLWIDYDPYQIKLS